MRIIAAFEESNGIGFLLNLTSLTSYGNNTQHHGYQRYILICKFFFLLPIFPSWQFDLTKVARVQRDVVD